MKYIKMLKEKTAPKGGSKPDMGFINTPTPGPARTAKSPFYSFYSTRGSRFCENTLASLLSEVGSEIIQEDSSHVLRFNPYLEGPQVDPERWAKAVELEAMFMEATHNG